jgi:hypothetical protein
MSQNPQEKNTSLVLTQPPVNRRDFLKRSSIIPAAGALSVVGGSALLLAPTDASAAGPDVTIWQRVGAIQLSTSSLPWAGTQTTVSYEYWVLKNHDTLAAQDKTRPCQMWRTDWTRPIDCPWGSAAPRCLGTRTYTYMGTVEIATMSNHQEYRMYNSSGKVFAYIAPDAYACAERDGRNLRPAADLGKLLPRGAISQFVYVSKKVWNGLPMFLYISYRVGQDTFYRFARLVSDSYEVTEALSGSTDSAFIQATIDLLAKYDEAVLNIRITGIAGSFGAAVGTAMGLTDPTTGIAAYGVATVVCSTATSIAKIGLSDIHKVSAASGSVRAKMSEKSFRSFSTAIASVCLPEDHARI